MKRQIGFVVLGIGLLFWFSLQLAAAEGPNDQCLTCHGGAVSTMTVGAEKVGIFVDPTAFAKSKHGSVACTACHTGLNPTPPHNAKRIYGSWARFSVKNTDTTKTRNFYTVTADACLACHTGASFTAFLKSDHATIKDLKNTPAGHPRVERKVTGTDGKQYVVDENFVADDCERCHIQTNCGTCHWKAPVIQKTVGNILDTWTDYSKAADTIKGGQSEFGLDWTFNVAAHEFRTSADLKSTNDVCMACHIGYYQGDKSVPAIGVLGMGVRRHPQVEELALSAKRGVHETKKTCTSCHTEIHNILPRTTEHGARVGGNTQCTDCHADRKLTALHADASCVACHDAELTTVQRDTETKTIEPVAVKHNLSESWPSHNLTKDVKCAKCHVAGNPVGASATVARITIHTPATAAQPTAQAPAGAPPKTLPTTGAAEEGHLDSLKWPLVGGILGLAGVALYAARRRQSV